MTHAQPRKVCVHVSVLNDVDGKANQFLGNLGWVIVGAEMLKVYRMSHKHSHSSHDVNILSQYYERKKAILLT